MHNSYQESIIAKAESQKRYDKTHTMQISLKFNLKTDSDIVEWLNRQSNKQSAIKTAIRKQIMQEQKK